MTDLKKIRARWEHDGAVLRITLASPKGNVLDSTMMSEIVAAVDKAAANPELRLIAFDADGEHFSFGASVAEHTRDKVAPMLDRFHAMVLKLVTLRVPTAALVRGLCLGGGFELAMCCHWILAEEGARFGLPEINLAVFAPAASALLPRRVGAARAEDWLISGRHVSAQEAREAGLVRAVVEEGKLEDELRRVCGAEILGRSAIALRFATRAVRLWTEKGLEEDLAELTRFYLGELMGSCDANEGIAAFLEKRLPRFVHA